MSARAKQITSKIDNEKLTLTITVVGKEPIIIGVKDLDQDMVNMATLHGLKQKIVDAAALGASYSTREKYEAMSVVVERITGEFPSWNVRSEGGGSVTGLLFRALCRLYPEKDPSVLRAYHDGLSKSEQCALRKNPKVAVVIEELKAEKVDTKGVDSDLLLDALDGLDNLDGGQNND